MTIKEELELLRGEPIEENVGDPLEIPYIETSDPERLCKHPVVSVLMITYNHEKYIRDAIEGVMMQNTDFEFELVIGEDASTDRTREICFEYQKKYPEKIRVLWWHENLRKIHHPAGGNLVRTRSHCRGEFIAFCEGDDYWIDSYKLQKQVDVMRKYPNVGFCLTGAKVKSEIGRNHPRLKTFKIDFWNDDDTFVFDMGNYKPGLVEKNEFWKNRKFYPRTVTMLYRVAVQKMFSQMEIFNWKMNIGDALLWNAFPFFSDAYYLQDITAVYRLNFGGVSLSITDLSKQTNVEIDVIEYYFDVIKGDLDDALVKKKIIFNKRFEYTFKYLKSKNELIKLILSPVFDEVICTHSLYWKLYVLLLKIGVKVPIRYYDSFLYKFMLPVRIYRRIFR